MFGPPLKCSLQTPPCLADRACRQIVSFAIAENKLDVYVRL